MSFALITYPSASSQRSEKIETFLDYGHLLFLTGSLFGILGEFSKEFHNHLQNSNYKVEKTTNLNCL